MSTKKVINKSDKKCYKKKFKLVNLIKKGQTFTGVSYKKTIKYLIE